MTRGGGCLCGSVRYTVGGPLREILVCHCIECRRWAGHAWAATAARTADLEIGDTADRGFCVRCGASLFWRVPGWDRVSISAGTLDEPSGLHVAAHIWVEQGADWERPADDVPAYRGGYPPDARPLVWGDGS